jgi:hypothetical protein
MALLLLVLGRQADFDETLSAATPPGR